VKDRIKNVSPLAVKQNLFPCKIETIIIQANKLKSEEGLFLVNLTILSLLAKNKSRKGVNGSRSGLVTGAIHAFV
jgi:hypothetical protein